MALGLFVILAPLSPLLAVLFILKKIEQLCFCKAFPISLMNKYNRENRIIMVIVDGHIKLDKLQERFVQCVIDAHGVDGVLRFPNVTRAIREGYFHTYWVDEKRFDIADHIEVVTTCSREQKHSFKDIPTLLNGIQQTKFQDDKGDPLSPWRISISYLDGGRSAVFFKIDQALDDNAIICALFAGNNQQDRTDIGAHLPNHAVDYVTTFKHVGLAGWLMFRSMITFGKGTFQNFGKQDLKKAKKTYLCSKSLDTSIFQQLGCHFGVSARYVILSCVTMAISHQNISYLNVFGSQNGFENLIDISTMALKLKTLNGIKRWELKEHALKLKSRVRLDPGLCDHILEYLVTILIDNFLPNFVVKRLYFFKSGTRYCGKNKELQIQVIMNSFDMSSNCQQNENNSFLNCKMQSFTVWNEHTLTSSSKELVVGSNFPSQNKGVEGGMTITVTDNMKHLVVSTVSDQKDEAIALDFLKRFYDIHNEITQGMATGLW